MHSQPRWYALTVRAQHEKSTARVLAAEGLESFLPLYRSRRRWSDRVQEIELPLFPGYVFGRFGLQERLKVLLTPGVVSIVGFGGHPAPVGEEELAAIQRMLTSGLRLQPWPYLRAGQRVWIERGPLGGLEGILVRSKDYWRVVVNVELLQRSVAVEIDRDALSPVASAAQPVARPAVSCTCA
jgi:transcription antitermination factor NusG